MGLKAPKLSLILVACVFALSCFGFTLFVWKSFGGPTPFQAHGYRAHILFGSEASQLTPNADVRISGVNVGKVITVKRRGLGADALVEVQSRFAPLPSDTQAIIRFKTLLGETFVELTPGSSDAPPLRENGTLARKNVADVQQVDRVLGAFDKPTREAFKQFLIDTSKALDGRGSDLNSAIGHLAPTAESTRDLMVILDRQRGSLSRLIRDSGQTLSAMADRGEDLRSLITAGNQVFGATASRNREVTRTVQLLPNFLRETRDALGDIDAAARDAAPTLRALRPVIPLIRPALDETANLAPELKRTFDALNPTITAAKTGFPALTRILKTARPALKTLYVAGRELVPVAQILDPYKADVMASLAKVGSATNYDYPTADGKGQKVLRVVIPVNEEAVYGQTARLGSNRTNTYPAPRALDNLKTGLKSFDCRNADNPQNVPIIGQAPPCIDQGPFRYRKVSRRFPHVTIDGK